MTEPTALPHGFDVRAYTAGASGDLKPGIDHAALAASPADAALSSTLTALRAVERSTMWRLRQLLVTPTHKDARVTAFLVTWAYEKYWIADALAVVTSPDPATAHRESLPSRVAERLRPIATAVRSNLIGPDVTTAHVVAGYADSVLLLATYRSLADTAGNAELGRLLTRIADVTAQHEAFFEDESHRRLPHTSRGRRLARAAVRDPGVPLGAQRLDARTRSALLLATNPFRGDVATALAALPWGDGSPVTGTTRP